MEIEIEIERERKILVTGGAGFIGSNFIRYCLENHPSDKVVNLDALTYAGYLPSLDDVVQKYPDRYTFARGSIGNRELVDYLLDTYKPDIIVNFAAESHNSRAVMNPGIFFETNVIGTQKLLDASLAHDVKRFHHISTCEVYGDMALDSNEKFSEQSPYRPRTPYNASKAAADMAVRAYNETFGLSVTISNCSNNYGPYQFPEKVIPLFIANALTGKPMTLYESSRNKREWLHVIDHCRAIDAILEGGKPGETYNIGSGVEADIEEIADLILQHLGLDASFKTYVPDRPGHDRRYLLDSTKIEVELGWEPTIFFDRGIHDTIEWYKRNRSWWEPLLQRVAINESKWMAK
ncbi:MAG: dTDP-glucose 4,6-dehydratase [bacterium]|nr:dTDP-glucose 4,6-dehydratase [bacterium]